MHGLARCSPSLGQNSFEHARDTGLRWREDPTNAQTHAYTRNALRHGPLAALVSQKEWRTGMRRSVETLQAQWETLQALGLAAYKEVLLATGPTSLTLDRTRLERHPPGLQMAIFQRAHLAMRVQKPWHAKHFHLLAEALRRPGASHLVLPGARLDLEATLLCLWRTTGRGRQEHDALKPEPVGFEATSAQGVPWFFGSFRPAPLQPPTSTWEARLDPDKTYTVCAGKTPKLSERLRALGVPRSWRPWWPHVHEVDSGHLVWVPGLTTVDHGESAWEFHGPPWVSWGGDTTNCHKGPHQSS